MVYDIHIMLNHAEFVVVGCEFSEIIDTAHVRIPSDHTYIESNLNSGLRIIHLMNSACYDIHYI